MSYTPRTINIRPLGGVSASLIGGVSGPISHVGLPLPLLPIGVTNPIQPVTPPYFPNTILPLPRQIIGMVPLMPCSYQDCRDTKGQCFLNPVFGTPGVTTSTYENDMNTFFLDYIGNNFVQFVIQKQVGNAWVNKAVISDNTYGVLYKVGYFSTHPTYTGFTVNWGTVIGAFSQGIYRIAVNLCIASFTPSALTISAVATATVAAIPNSVTNGVLTIGAWSSSYINYTGINATTLNYLSSIINSSNIVTSYVNGNTIVINGLKGAIIKFSFPTNPPPQITWALTGGTDPVPGQCQCAYESLPFILNKFNCDKAHGTMKFESRKTGTQGSVTEDGYVFDLCNITIFDSIRVRGFFGYSEFDNDQVLEEWGINNTKPFGTIDLVRDKTVRSYKWSSFNLPLWIHERLAAYAFTAQTLLVSDYNHNNSDYYIKQRNVIRVPGYKPEYLDDKPFDPTLRTNNRTGSVKVNFKQGIQGIITSIFCQQTTAIIRG